jgi:hypothetical protein
MVVEALVTLALTLPLPQAVPVCPQGCVSVAVVQRVVETAQDKLKPMRWALSAYGVASAVDRSTTVSCIATGACEEVGVLRFANDHPGTFAAVGASIDVAVGWGLYKLAPKRPKLAFWTTIALTAFKVGVVIRNARVMSQ